MSRLSRDGMLKPVERRYLDFRLSNGQEGRVRSLTERERAEYESGLFDSKGGLKKDRLLSARRRLVCMTLVDDSGTPLFAVSEEHLLADQDGKLIEEIYQAAAAHIGIKDSDVEAIVKNSPATPVAG